MKHFVTTLTAQIFIIVIRRQNQTMIFRYFHIFGQTYLTGVFIGCHPLAIFGSNTEPCFRSAFPGQQIPKVLEKLISLFIEDLVYQLYYVHEFCLRNRLPPDQRRHSGKFYATGSSFQVRNGLQGKFCNTRVLIRKCSCPFGTLQLFLHRFLDL